jgi:hypothetical protein
VEDVAFRVIAAQQKPDHATIARFRVRHEAQLADLFSDVLVLCREAGLVKVGVIAIDGTKLHANASHHANLDYQQLAREILKEAGDVDAAEDELYGDARGDELPEALRTPEGRRAALKTAKLKLRVRAASTDANRPDDPEAVVAKIELDSEAIVARVQGRKGWLREGRQQLDRLRVVEARPIPARVRSGCSRRSFGCRRILRSSGTRTRPSKLIARTAGRVTGSGSVRGRRPTRRRMSRRERSTRPIWTRAT